MLGLTRGGLTSKLHLSCDGHGRLLSLMVTAGQRHDSTQLEPVLDAIRVPVSAVDDRANGLTGSQPAKATSLNTAGGCCGDAASGTRFRHGAISDGGVSTGRSIADAMSLNAVSTGSNTGGGDLL